MILTDKPTLKPDKEDLDEAKDEDVPFIKLREMNATAFSMLRLSTKEN